MKRVLIRITIIAVSLMVVVTICIGIYLTDKDLSGFTGMYAIAKLTQGNDYTLVSKSPVQYLAKRDSFPKALIDIGDEGCFSEPPSDIYAIGRIMIDGKEYQYKTRAFTSNYYVITVF